jgi:arginyl-tRNA synthetase
VLQAPDETTRQSRLRLCDLTARVLADGLNVLGIPPLERM